MIDSIDKIPVELRPALDRMAFEMASALGWQCPSGYDFSTNKNPRAIVALQTLDDYCMDGYGVGLSDLVGLLDEENVEMEKEDCVII